MPNLSITLKLLFFLKDKGYRSLLLKYGEDTYIPVLEGMDQLLEKISILPFKEDQVIDIKDAIELFEELELSEKEIVNIFENG